MGWRERIREALSRRPRGDVIAAEVGSDARGVVVGKNIIQIGTFVIPTIPVLLMLAAALVSAGLLAWRLLVPVRGPTKMSGSFNVALAEFGEIDAAGHVGPSETGTRLSRWVFEAFQTQRDQSPDLKAAVQIWHDSLPLSQKGTTIGIIMGQSPEMRGQAAAQLARAIDAQMVIYGNLDAGGHLTPEFYVAPPLRQGADIHGAFKMDADPVPVDLEAGLALSRQLSARALGLFWMAVGLSYDRGGLQADALKAFRQADSTGDWSKAGRGRELLYFFIGQSALFGGRDDEAEAAFRSALSGNENFAGAHIGLGSVYFTRAQRLQPPRLRLETTDLQSAIGEYSEAVRVTPDAPDRAWATYAAPLALGMAYRLQGEALLDSGNQAGAAEALDTAVARITATIEPMNAAGEHRMIGQAYLALGTAHAEQAELARQAGDARASQDWYRKAREAYAGCIAQGQHAPLDETLTKTIIAGLCQPYDARAAAALADH